MKKSIALLLSILLLVLLLPACNSNEGNNGNNPSTNNSYIDSPNRLNIVCTIFPQYDWIMEIMGDLSKNHNITLLLGSKIDLHNYQPSVDDIVSISTCDLFIYVGGLSDVWVEDVLSQPINKDMIVLNLLDSLGDRAKIELIIEGMEHDDHDHGNEAEDEYEHDENPHDEDAHDKDAHDDEYDEDDHMDDHIDDHDDDHDDNDDHDDDDDHEDNHDDDDDHDEDFDEHIWLSLKNAQHLCSVIADSLARLDPENADIYYGNLVAYVASLNELDARYQQAVSDAPVQTLLFGDRFPFRYLLDDYNINYYAAFPGCSAETEASFETIIFLVNKVDELELKCIMITDSGDLAIASTIKDNSKTKNQIILALDSIQTVSMDDISAGATYLSIMEKNLAVLVEALS